jgi:hypothetical protein
MERYRKLEIVIDGTLEDADKALLFDQLAAGTAEMVKRNDDTIIWADTPDAEDLLIESIIKKGKMKGEAKRFPKRWAETTDLGVEGELSLDGTKKLLKLCCANLNGYVPLRQRPEGYDVTSEFLEGLTYTDLKNFIRRYPDLDAELNLSSAKAVLLEATKNYFGISDIY